MNCIKLTINGCRVENAQHLADQYESTPPWMYGINQVSNPAGTMPGMGRFLINRQDYDNDFPEGPFDITLQRMGGSETETTTLSSYVTVSASAASRSFGSPMIVEIADARLLLRKAITSRSWNLDGDTSSTWGDVLNDLKTDLPGFDANLNIIGLPSFRPSNLRYEGWRTVDALADVGYRLGQVLTYNQRTGSLQFSRMTGEQSSDQATIDEAKLHRNFELPPTPTASEIGSVSVMFDAVDSGPSGQTEISNPQSTSQQSQVAWATILGQGGPTYDNQSSIDDEAQSLADTWFDYTSRNSQRTLNEYFGALDVVCGSAIGSITWRVYDAEFYTTIDTSVSEPPVTKRQPLRSGGAGSTIVLAQAQSGGIPKRNDAVMGSGSARLLVRSPSTGNLELTDLITVLNPSNRIAGEKGDRLIWLSDNTNNALVIGWDDPNDGDPSGFAQQQPQSN